MSNIENAILSIDNYAPSSGRVLQEEWSNKAYKISVLADKRFEVVINALESNGLDFKDEKGKLHPEVLDELDKIITHYEEQN